MTMPVVYTIAKVRIVQPETGIPILEAPDSFEPPLTSEEDARAAADQLMLKDGQSRVVSMSILVAVPKTITEWETIGSTNNVTPMRKK